MSRKKKMKMEYRFYEVPEKCPVLALLGEKWVQNYGYQIDYLHFHNLLEIGFCYSGEGIVILKEEELPYHGDMFTVVPKNFPHTTNSLEHQMCSWAWLFIDVEGFIAELYQNNTRMAQKLIARINQKAHLVRCTEKPEVAELIRMLIRCMDEKQEFYLEEAKGLTRALLMQIARWNEKDEKQEKDTVMENASITMICRIKLHQRKLQRRTPCGRTCNGVSYQRDASSQNLSGVFSNVSGRIYQLVQSSDGM